MPEEIIKAVLARTVTSDTGTFGTLAVLGRDFISGELPDRDNAPDKSCIPPGTYLCKWTWSNRFQRKTYEVMDVPGRSGIRFHRANFCGDKSCGKKSELNGCIALGLKHGALDGQECILESGEAMDQFHELLNERDFELTIEGAFNGRRT